MNRQDIIGKHRGRILFQRKTKHLVLLVLFCALWPMTGHGYVLQGPHILELMIDALSGAKTLQVEQRVTIHDKALAATPVELEETLSFRFPDHFRSDTRYADTQRIYVSAPGQHLLVIDGKISDDPPSRFGRYKDLLLYHSRQLLNEVLSTYGVDVETTSLGRFEDQVVYVIGAQYPDASVSQVWVDKETFLPVRWLDVDPDHPADRLEFVYRYWRQINKVWYPMQIETYYRNTLMRTIHVRQVRVDAQLSPDLLDIDHLKTIYRSAAPAESSPPKDTSVDEVRKALESFQKKFEP